MLQAVAVFNIASSAQSSATVNLHTAPTSSLPTSSSIPTPPSVALASPHPPVASISVALMTPTLTLPPDAANPTGGMQELDSESSYANTFHAPLQPYVLFSVSVTDSLGVGAVSTSGLQLRPAFLEGDGILRRLGSSCPDDAVDADTGHGFCSAWIPPDPDRFPEPGAEPTIVYVTIEAQVCLFLVVQGDLEASYCVHDDVLGSHACEVYFGGRVPTPYRVCPP